MERVRITLPFYPTSVLVQVECVKNFSLVILDLSRVYSIFSLEFWLIVLVFCKTNFN